MPLRFNTAKRMLAVGDMDAAIAQLWEGISCSDAPEVIDSLIDFVKLNDSEEVLGHLSNYAAQKPETSTSQSALTKLYQALEEEPVSLRTAIPTILVDGVVFQIIEKAGIARVWTSLLEEWANNEFGKHIILLDRAGTAPSISGIRYIKAPAYGYGTTDNDREMLQQVCEQVGADLFISTYYTTPLSTPSVFLAHDMIPELMGWNLSHPMWREKHYGIRHASAFIAVSENTARDLCKVFPKVSLQSVTIANNGVDRQLFCPAIQENIQKFKTKYGITKPYFILVGPADGYKNSLLFFKAFSQLASQNGFEIVCTGRGSLLESEFRAYTSGSLVHILQLDDRELAAAYSGAVALVYPSKYEGFGLPILEAMSCGCPVITCPNASIPEVTGEAALYVSDFNVEELADALCEIQKPSVRKLLIAAGLEQARQFSWSKMAKTVSSALIHATLLPLKLKENNFIIFPDWSQPEELLGEDLQTTLRAIAFLPNSQSITLLIDTSNIAYENAELFLSSVTMNLLMEEDLDVSQGLDISLVEELGSIQWEALLSRIQGRIILEHEDAEAIAAVKAENLLAFDINSLTGINEDALAVLF